MSVLLAVVGGGVVAPIVAPGKAGTFPHRPTGGCPAAEGSVSYLIGSARAGRCVRLAGLRAMGLSFHGRSVVDGTAPLNAEISAIQGGAVSTVNSEFARTPGAVCAVQSLCSTERLQLDQHQLAALPVSAWLAEIEELAAIGFAARESGRS